MLADQVARLTGQDNHARTFPSLAGDNNTESRSLILCADSGIPRALSAVKPDNTDPGFSYGGGTAIDMVPVVLSHLPVAVPREKAGDDSVCRLNIFMAGVLLVAGNSELRGSRSGQSATGKQHRDGIFVWIRRSR
ncbi:hypothetical protein O5623_17775 [Escherichia coli]|nr:hypothetical protein [Escherichia coli]